MFKNYLQLFKNKTKSLAKKHPMAIALHWETFPLKQNEYGPIKCYHFIDENVVNNEMLETILSKEVFSTRMVKVDGVECKAGLVICSAMEEDIPVFCQISEILLVKDHIIFWTNKLFTENFEDHHHAFKVSQTVQRCLIKMSEKFIYYTFIHNVLIKLTARKKMHK